MMINVTLFSTVAILMLLILYNDWMAHNKKPSRKGDD